MIDIVIADDHEVVRRGLRSVLDAEDDFRVVGEAADGLDALGAIERLRPNVLILDIMMPNLNGVEVTRQVSRYSPKTAVIILSMYSNEAYVLETMRNGASGYVLKDAGLDVIVDAVRTVAEGRRYLCPPLSERAIEAYMQKMDDVTDDPCAALTTREREVMQLAAEGLSNSDISARLCISPRTVEIHRANMMRKLGLHGKAELILFAVRQGFLNVDD